jgi:tRNA U34 5-methylaminomethyl-2-thiouridine-forming methyltransferase MnmC
LHESSWHEDSIISDDFILNKTRADISGFDFQRQFDLVYFDAFGPDKQPELWTTEIFSSIYQNMSTGAILTTYSSKGQIRRNMEKAGFRVEKLGGPPGKWDMTRAWKD